MWSSSLQTLGSKMAEGIETESKHRARDAVMVVDVLGRLGFRPTSEQLQADEYFDTRTGSLHAVDLVVRLRLVGARVIACFKGPRTYLPDGTYSRIEVELPAGTPDQVRAALAAQDLVCVWRLQKRRREYHHPDEPIVVCLDELPALGRFVELEGAPTAIASVRGALGEHIGPPERLNYRDLAMRWMADRGLDDNVLAFPG